MPLSPPAAREPIHTRRIAGKGFRREDGFWDIEGHLVDTKAYAFDNAWRGPIEPGDPLHEMWARLTVDSGFKVVAVECATDNAPFGPCGDILPNFQRLVGQTIGPGWSRRIKSLVGGAEGCAHHVELLCLLATVAFQTIGPLLAREQKAGGSPGRQSFLINSCHIWREGGEHASKFATDPDSVFPSGKINA